MTMCHHKSLPIFVVNLRKNAGRMESIKRQLDALGVEYRRFEAVYGKVLSDGERKKLFAWFRSRLAVGVKLTDGELGCALSHLGIYENIVSDGLDMAVVLEDDVLLEDNFVGSVKTAANFVNVEQPQVVLFSDYGQASVGICKRGIWEISNGSCTDGYLITRRAAELILKINKPVVVQADGWTRWHRRYGLQLYRLSPASVKQDNETFGTDIDAWTDANRKVIGNGTGRTGLNLLAFRVCRVFEKTFDWLLWKLGL